MVEIIMILFGIFVGMATTGYMAISEINKLERKVANKEAMIKNRDILIDDQCRILNKIRTEIKKQQYGSVENLQNKIKSILFNDGESEK